MRAFGVTMWCELRVYCMKRIVCLGWTTLGGYPYIGESNNVRKQNGMDRIDMRRTLIV